MSVTCPECSIRYAGELPACPWCGHVSEAASGSSASDVGQVSGAPAGRPPDPSATATPPQVEAPTAPTHTETRSAPPPPPPPADRAPIPSGSVTYDLGEIPGPEEEWEPVDAWLEGEDDAAWEPEGHEPIRRRLMRWAVLGIGGIALIVFGAFLAEVIPIGIGGGSSGTDPTTAPTVAATTITPAPTTQPPPETTLPPPTTTPPTTTTTPFIEPAGSALASTDLTIFETGFSELTFGSDGREALGRLAATFGQPDFDSGVRPTPASEDGGFCEGDLQRVVTWGSLSAYNSVDESGAETFRSVHLDAANATDPDPAAAAASLSGLQIGDSAADLRTIYEGFRIDEPGGGAWEIRAGSDGRLLLWGTATDSGEIVSIRSSFRCSG